MKTGILIQDSISGVWTVLPPGRTYVYPRSLSDTSEPLNRTSGSSSSLSCLGFLRNRPLSMTSAFPQNSLYLGSNLLRFFLLRSKNILADTENKNPDGWSRLAAELVPKVSGEHTRSECLGRKGWRCNIEMSSHECFSCSKS